MFRKLLTAVGIGVGTASNEVATPPYSPYANEATNAIYNLLFCDDIAAFRPQAGAKIVAWQAAIFSNPADATALRNLAADSSQEGRIRFLAYARLRRTAEPVPTKLLLGIIVEVPLSAGLDVIAAYSEGGVRYINQTGKLAVFEGVPSIQPLVRSLLHSSQSIVERIGPWGSPRLPPPKSGNIRLTFLVSDGLYFGEGPMQQMQRDPLAAQVIGHATSLLQAVVALSTKTESE